MGAKIIKKLSIGKPPRFFLSPESPKQSAQQPACATTPNPPYILRGGLPHRGYTFDSAGLASVTQPTLGKAVGREPMPSALYFLKSIFVWGNHSRIIHSSRVVMMCDEKKYNPQGGSLLACTVTQGRLRYTCQPCAIESITPMG